MTTPEVDATRADEAGVAAIALGLLSLVLCWWFPFGVVLGVAGLAAGTLGWLAGDRGGRAAFGVVLAAGGVGVGMLLAWGSWVRLLGV